MTDMALESFAYWVAPIVQAAMAAAELPVFVLVAWFAALLRAPA